MCLQNKEEKEFYKHSQTKDGLRSECKECWKVLCRNYQEDNKELIKTKRREYHFKSNYNLTLDELNMLKSKYKLCSICNTNKARVVDHSHRTGKVRELLCDKCNQGLGSFNENTEALSRAIKYLEKYNG